MLRLTTLCLTAACVLLPAERVAASQAGVVRDHTARASYLELVAAPAEDNDVVVGYVKGGVLVADAAGVTAGNRCKQLTANEVMCPRTQAGRMTLGDLDDEAWVKHGPPWVVDAGEGEDRLEGGVAGSALHGGPGDDRLVGRGGILTLELRGDEGDDDLLAHGYDAILYGGPGLDRLESTYRSELHTDLPDPTKYGAHYVGGPGADVFVGSEEGVAFVSYVDRTGPVSVDLDGEVDDGEPGESDVIGPGVDGIIGGQGDDALIGGAPRDVLIGGPGNDHLAGGAGADFLRGAAGADQLVGGPDADHLAGGLGPDELSGQDGADLLVPLEYEYYGEYGEAESATGDMLAGGDGLDSVTYARAAESVVVDTDGDANDGPVGKADNVMPDVERFVGTPHDDTFRGGPGDEVFVPVYGRDLIDAGPGDDRVEVDRGPFFSIGISDPPSPTPDAGIDLIFGGTGTDTVDYSDAAPARVDLSDPGVDGTLSQPQQLVDVENLLGSRYADGFIGGPGPNVFETRGGEDSVVLRSPEGDSVDCGNGDDTLETPPGAVVADCEVVQTRGGPRVELGPGPLEARTDFPQFRVRFSESWVSAQAWLVETRTRERLSETRELPASSRSERRGGFAMTPYGRRRLRRETELGCIVVIRMYDLGGRRKTQRFRRQVVLR